MPFGLGCPGSRSIGQAARRCARHSFDRARPGQRAADDLPIGWQRRREQNRGMVPNLVRGRPELRDDRIRQGGSVGALLAWASLLMVGRIGKGALTAAAFLVLALIVTSL